MQQTAVLGLPLGADRVCVVASLVTAVFTRGFPDDALDGFLAF